VEVGFKNHYLSPKSVIGENKLIFTMGIASLYTVIPNNEGLQALRFFFDQHTIKEPSSETLLCLAELRSFDT